MDPYNPYKVFEPHSTCGGERNEKQGELDETLNIRANSHQRKRPPFTVDGYIWDPVWYLDAQRFAEVAGSERL